MAAIQNTVLGKYRILKEIARSNDIVYEAIDPKMNRRVAIKELQLPLHLAGTQKRERVERFYREAKAAGTLTHPNIVTIHEVGQENDRHFLVMEYLDGQSLRDILQLQGALPLKETVDIALQLCDALSFAHAHGVVHRDVKPDNVHILPGGIIKLTDFGIARITAEPSITSQGQVFGTPSYMSPEQVASQTVDHRTDLFSLGITLYEMMTGRKPFVGDSVITITYNIMNVQPPMPQGVPPGLQTILQKALSKDPALRYQSAAQLAQDLRAQKFALAETNFDSTGRKQGPMTFAPAAGATMDTGVVPSHISGLPALTPSPGLPSSPMPSPVPAPYEAPVSQVPIQAQPAPMYAPQPIGQIDSVPPSATQISPQVGGIAGGLQGRKSTGKNSQRKLTLALSLVGLLAIVWLAVWTVTTAMHTMKTRGNLANASDKYLQATHELTEGNYDAAALDYQSARDTAPQPSDEYDRATQGLSAVRTAQGQQLAETGKRKDAEAAFLAAIKLNAKNAAAYDALGNLLMQGGDDANAIVYWTQAVHSDGTSAAATDARTNAVKAARNRAEAATRVHKNDAARTNWKTILDVSPGSPEAMDAQQHINNIPLAGLGGAH